MHRSKPTATSDQLKHDIDAGRTGDKVCASDPAAAPLGTDEEAAGAPIDPLLLAKVRDAERKKAASLADPVDARRRDIFSAVVIWLSAVSAGCATVVGSMALTRWPF
jgi:hypothetical protein